MEFLQEQHASSLLVPTLDLIENGAVITNAAKPDNPIVFVNKGFERVTGYSTKEAVGRNCRFLQGEETDKSSISEMKRAIKLVRPFERILLNYRKDGTPFWNRINIKPVRLDKTLYFIGLQYDVTDKMNLNVDIEAAKKEIEDLSIPIISLDDETMVVPLVGQMDANRSFLLIDKLSDKLFKTETEHVIVDVTGLYLDSSMTEEWIQNLRNTVRLLGAELIISGVSPKMAFYFNRTMNDIADMQFYSSLQVALGSIKRNRPGRV
ncbi:PAS domain-containing protein [Domibacillus sp.]|uniref:STAS domain-containing protein n=1 Tax=Domibacillus sp. TaxID=1969783 RepID=UPI0028114735|nr:PAS domain-containing protein [Domibacillus sp.]